MWNVERGMWAPVCVKHYESTLDRIQCSLRIPMPGGSGNQPRGHRDTPPTDSHIRLFLGERAFRLRDNNGVNLARAVDAHT